MTPTATYRLQLHHGFRFADAKRITAYLDELGISHVYASPYLAAQPGSTHGYNLVDPSRLNPEIGSEAEYLDWVASLGARKMGHIVDVVPNHMAATQENAWWHDVLENGPSSLYAEHFDIDWHPPKEALHGRVLLPILGAQYGETLEKGELKVERNGGAFCLRYWERCLPLNPNTIAPILEAAAAALDLPSEDPRRQDLESIAAGLRKLPPTRTRSAEEQRERAREKEVLKRRLATLGDDPTIATAIDAEVERLNGRPGEPRSFDALDRVLMDQAYRLAYWRVATEEINYRRFFDINDLAAVRMEESAVFDDAHALLLRLIADGHVDGIRLDHTDGLYDPADYFAKLRRAIRERRDSEQGFYVVAEKILGRTEELPRTWEIDGTTGYDFLVQVSGVFVDPAAEGTLTRVYRDATGDARSFGDHVLQAKRAILRSSLSSELHMLAQRLERIAMKDRRFRDFTLATLRRAASETITAFPVYRTYVRPDGARTPTDDAIVVRATRLARKRNPEVSPSVFDFLRDVLLFERLPEDDDARRERAEFAMRFQQLTGPVTAKGVEDTAFYTYPRFVALNEVGGHPDRFGTSPTELHAANAARLASWPRAMTATSTHDTKRGEDVRARLAVLSEIPETWERWTHELLGLAERHARIVDDEPAPTRIDQYMFLQTALGAWPLAGDVGPAFTERLVAFAIKAAREAKQSTSWLAPDETYEDALRSFIEGAMGDPAFATSLAAKSAAIATYGASNGIAQALIKIASPGVPDTYQGSETWDLRLVDPDNRAPVDYEALSASLRSLEGAKPADLLATFADGRLKMHVVRAALRLRRRMPEIFLRGEYTPLTVDDGSPESRAEDPTFAFTRSHDRGQIVCAATRLPWRVTGGETPWAIGETWGARTIAVPDGKWSDALSGRVHESRGGLAARALFTDLPVALLWREGRA